MRRRTFFGALALTATGAALTPGLAHATGRATQPDNGVSPVPPKPAHPNGIQVATEVIPGARSEFPMLRTKRVDAQAEKVLAVDYQVQETGYWCGPASTRIALSARVGAPSQATLAAELGTHTGGTDHISQITRVLNARIDSGTYYTYEMPNDPPTQEQSNLLWSLIVDNVNHNHTVVTNIVAPPGNQPPGYPPGQTIYHYFTVIGYNSDHGTVCIADPASFNGYQIYWLTHAHLASLVPPKGYSA